MDLTSFLNCTSSCNTSSMHITMEKICNHFLLSLWPICVARICTFECLWDVNKRQGSNVFAYRSKDGELAKSLALNDYYPGAKTFWECLESTCIF